MSTYLYKGSFYIELTLLQSPGKFVFLKRKEVPMKILIADSYDAELFDRIQQIAYLCSDLQIDKQTTPTQPI